MNIEQPKFKTSDEVDFVIIGSGAAGGILANEIKVLGEDLLTNHPKLQPTTFRKTPQDKAKQQRALVYGRTVGGTSVHFTANFWRFHEIDFIERGKVGAIPGRNLVDWPIRYADLEPYYTKVGWEIGAWGLGGGRPLVTPRW